MLGDKSPAHSRGESSLGRSAENQEPGFLIFYRAVPLRKRAFGTEQPYKKSGVRFGVLPIFNTS